MDFPFTAFFYTHPRIIWKDLIHLMNRSLWEIYTVHWTALLPITHLELLNIVSKISLRWDNTFLLQYICTIQSIHILFCIMCQMKNFVNIYKNLFVIILNRGLHSLFTPYIWSRLCILAPHGIQCLHYLWTSGFSDRFQSIHSPRNYHDWSPIRWTKLCFTYFP